MFLTDTHTHLYLEEFISDQADVIQRAIAQNVKSMLLPNIDSSSIDSLLKLSDQFPENCFPMMGLHPTSVKENYEEELVRVEKWIEKRKFYAIGETGIDLYWDKTFGEEQKTSFRHQIGLAKKYNLPIVIHMRNSFDEIYIILKEEYLPNLRGVFHCFTGNLEQAYKIFELGFKIGIGGVVTFKNSGLDKVLEKINLNHVILETDSPFLAPVPFRGKRNESSYLKIIAKKIAQIKNKSVEEIAEITTANAKQLFNF
jgi:TatD DNase family protein